MDLDSKNLQIISAPSILGLKPNGVEELSNSLLSAGLAGFLKTRNTPLSLEVLNNRYNHERDRESNVLNPEAIKKFSLSLGQTVLNTINNSQFPVVLGGDCSIIIGIMSALKARANCGLIFLDAHADFYQPERSITGEVTDMDLAIVTGRGPEILTNINNLKPYVKDENIVHIGQRDIEETLKYKSQDIRKTPIKCLSLIEIRKRSAKTAANEVLQYLNDTDVKDFWIHYDTDVLSDKINPAVDYRLPGGLTFEQVEYFIKSFLLTGRITGISITIFNPRLDRSGHISKRIAESLGNAFNLQDPLKKDIE